MPGSELYLVFIWINLKIWRRKALFNGIVDQDWDESRLTLLDIVLLCFDGVGLKWVSWTARSFDKPRWKAVYWSYTEINHFDWDGEQWPGPEFLNVTVSKLCDCATFFWFCAKSWNLYVQSKTKMQFNHFYR